MTCIVGLVQDGAVYLGGDSAGIRGWDLRLRADPKVFTRPFTIHRSRSTDQARLVVGYTSSFRMGQLLRYELAIPEWNSLLHTPHAWAVQVLIPTIRTTLKEGGYVKRENEREEGGAFLIGFQGHLFQIESDFQVAATLDPFAACGCGDQAALGALYATARVKDAHKRLGIALAAAERFSAGVHGPFVFEAV